MEGIEAKREARRRKILENSENRLKKINGVQSRVTKTEIDGKSFHVSEEFKVDGTTLEDYSTLVQETGNNSIIADETIENNIKAIFQNPLISLEDSVSQIFAAQPSNPRHFYILILSLLMSFLLTLCEIFKIDVESIYVNKIFLPLIGYEIYEYIYTPNIQFSNSIVSTLILLSNKPYSRQLNFCLRYFIRTVQDILIYFFVFLMSQLCIKLLFFKL